MKQRKKFKLEYFHEANTFKKKKKEGQKCGDIMEEKNIM